MSTIQDPRKTWLATGSLPTVWWRMPVSGARIAPRLPALAVTCLPLCLQRREGPVCSQLALLWCSSILCSVSGPGCTLEPFTGKLSSHFFFFPSLAIPQFGLLSHVNSLRLSSGHSGPVLTLRTNDAAHTSLSSPCSLVAYVSIWAVSPLEIVVRHLFCGFFSFFPPSYVAL